MFKQEHLQYGIDFLENKSRLMNIVLYKLYFSLNT